MKSLRSLKDHPEIRHAFAHFELAIRALAEGQRADALYELDQIQSMIYFDSDEAQVKHARRLYKWRSARKAKASAVRAKGSTKKGSARA